MILINMDSLLKSGESLIITCNLLIADELKLFKNLKLNFISHSGNINTIVFSPLRIKKERKEDGREGGKGKRREG